MIKAPGRDCGSKFCGDSAPGEVVFEGEAKAAVFIYHIKEDGSELHAVLGLVRCLAGRPMVTLAGFQGLGCIDAVSCGRRFSDTDLRSLFSHWVARISIGSCSTQPGSNASSTTMQRIIGRRSPFPSS